MLSEERQQEVRDLLEAGKEISEIYTPEEYEDLVEEMLEMLNIEDDPEVIYPGYQVYITPQGVSAEEWNKFVRQADELFAKMFKTDNAWEDR